MLLHIVYGLSNNIVVLIRLLFALPLQLVEDLLKIVAHFIQATKKSESPDALQLHLQGGGQLPDLVAEAVIIVQDVSKARLMRQNKIQSEDFLKGGVYPAEITALERRLHPSLGLAEQVLRAAGRFFGRLPGHLHREALYQLVGEGVLRLAVEQGELLQPCAHPAYPTAAGKLVFGGKRTETLQTGFYAVFVLPNIQKQHGGLVYVLKVPENQRPLQGRFLGKQSGKLGKPVVWKAGRKHRYEDIGICQPLRQVGNRGAQQ